VPWFLGRPQSAGIQLFSRDLNFQLLPGQRLEQETRGITLTYGRRLGLFSNISLSLSRFESLDSRPIQLPDGDFFTQEFDRTVSSLRALWSRDRRDSRLQPTVGTRYNASIELAGGPLGGTTDFVRARGTYTRYQPITKTGLRTVAALNVEAGAIEPIDDAELFFFDRFYLGGENSVRGFRFRSIWARDSEGNTILDEFGTPLGGDRFLRANAELILLVGGPFRLIGYVDTGGVFITEQEFDIDQMRVSAGMELQVNVPLFGAPLRFIYAQNVDPLPDDRFETFQFSIGPSF
jgi:outer membrane protein insertion porin family